MGHHSVLEHINITFAIDDISRACSHQLVRHRIASYSQQSQRYVNFKKGFKYIVPTTIGIQEELSKEYVDVMEKISDFYEYMVERCGVPAEDARYIIPNACGTNITMTVNARELIEMCKLRLCAMAQWEIRNLFELIKTCVNNNRQLRFLSEYLTPKCEWLKYCPEGKKSCGRIPTPKDGD